MLREARRQNRAYQLHSYEALAKYAATRQDLDLSEDILDIITPTVEELTTTDEDAMDVDDDKGKVKDTDRDSILIGAIKALREGLYSPLAVANKSHLSNILPHLKILGNANSTHSRAISMEIFTTLSEQAFPDFKVAKPPPVSSKKGITEILVQLLFQPRYNSFPEDGRLKRARAIEALAEAGPAWRAVAKEVLVEQGRLGEALDAERISIVKEVLAKAGNMLV